MTGRQRGNAPGVDDAAALVRSDTVDLGGVVHTVAVVHARSHALVRLTCAYTGADARRVVRNDDDRAPAIGEH